jgi:hypothetical protein
MVIDDDDALSLGGHFYLIVEVYFGMLKGFSWIGMVFYFVIIIDNLI